MSLACLTSPNLTDKEVNVRNEWGGVERTAKKKKDYNSPAVMLFDIFLFHQLFLFSCSCCDFSGFLVYGPGYWRHSGSVRLWLLSKKTYSLFSCKKFSGSSFLPERHIGIQVRDWKYEKIGLLAAIWGSGKITASHLHRILSMLSILCRNPSSC